MSQNPHDGLFKHVFSQPALAADELARALPRALARRIDWSSLRLVPGSFVDPHLRQRHTDLLFQVNAKGRAVFLQVLVEHRSDPDGTLMLRFAGYVVRIHEAFAREHPGEPLPLVVPIVFAHVRGGWKTPTELSAMVSVPDDTGAWTPFVPRLRCLVVDLATLDDDALLARPPVTGATLMLLRDARRGRLAMHMRRVLSVWESVEREAGGETLRVLVSYIVSVVAETERHEVFEFLDRVGERTREEAMRTIADSLRDEGRVEGRVEGLREAVRSLLEQRFGGVSAECSTRILQADAARLDRWMRRVLSATSIDEALAD